MNGKCFDSLIFQLPSMYTSSLQRKIKVLMWLEEAHHAWRNPAPPLQTVIHLHPHLHLHPQIPQTQKQVRCAFISPRDKTFCIIVTNIVMSFNWYIFFHFYSFVHSSFPVCQMTLVHEPIYIYKLSLGLSGVQRALNMTVLPFTSFLYQLFSDYPVPYSETHFLFLFQVSNFFFILKS